MGTPTQQALKQAFTGADVTLNAIDIQGVRSQADNVRGELTATNDGLYLLTNPTGGTVFSNSNDLTDNFARMLHQQEFADRVTADDQEAAGFNFGHESVLNRRTLNRRKRR